MVGRVLGNVVHLFARGPVALAGGGFASVWWPESGPLGPLLIFVAGLQFCWWVFAWKLPRKD